MLWHAMPPEVNTARLMVGAGSAPMLQSAAGWTAMGSALQMQADQLAAILTSLGAAWQGASGDRAIAAVTPMVSWLQTAAAQSQRRAQQASAQAAAHSMAMAGTPSLPEIAANHITTAVLTATNFLGINTMPIAAKEADYFVRMWNQAAAVMDVYQAESAANTTFEPLPPMKPVLMPGVGEMVENVTMGMVAELATKSAVSEHIAALTAELTSSNTFGVLTSVGEALRPDQNWLQLLSQSGQYSAPVVQIVNQAMQQVSSISSMGSSSLGGMPDAAATPQLGLAGASAMSNHPLAGGTGPTKGAGLLQAGDLPGAGGSSPRTPLLAQMLESTHPAAVSAGAAGSAMGGAAGAGMGAAPVGMAGHGAQSAAVKTGAMMPMQLGAQQDEQDRGDYRSYDFDGDAAADDDW